MERYSFLKHKCDIRMKVEADNLRNLFHVALKGMNSIVLGDKKLSDKKKEEILEINLDSVDITALLIDFLSEVLSETNIGYIIYEELEVLELEEKHIKAKLKGRTIQGFDVDIKAVTYHEAEVKLNRKGYYESVIVFDI